LLVVIRFPLLATAPLLLMIHLVTLFIILL
jgi:hypothetical protein